MKIIVTGATGLIGKTLVPCLREKGHEVIECSRSLGHDLTDEKFVEEFFEENRADALVNLFGLDDKLKKHGDVWNFTTASIKEYLEANVVALFFVCREFARWNTDKCRRNNVSIVNFSSIYGVVSPDCALYDGHKHVGYAVSKAAVNHLSKYLAVHLAPRVRVNTVICGGVRGEQGKEFVEKYNKKVPMGRMAEPEELVGLVEFLCSPASSYCTGGEFTIDGGYTAL